MFFSRPWPPPLSTRKISETLLDFARPVTTTLPRDIEPEILQRTLKVALAVWNAVVLDAWSPKDRSRLEKALVDMFLQSEKVPEPQREVLRWGFARLVKRKRKWKFRKDLRTIHGLQVFRAPDGDVRIRAEWKLSKELQRHYAGLSGDKTLPTPKP